MVVALPDNKRAHFQALQLSTVGLTLVFAIAVGTGLGIWLDNRLDTEPACTVVGFFLGVAAGFTQLLRAVKRL